MRDSFDRDALDVGIGAVGFFAFAFFAVTLWCELTGRDALGWALTLLAFVLVLGALLFARRRMSAAAQRRTGPGPGSHEGSRDGE